MTSNDKPRLIPIHHRAALVVLALFVGLSLVVSGCAKQGISIGAAGPYTGDLSKIGLDSLNAIRMAVDEFNAAGGINGQEVELIVGDDEAQPSKALAVAEKFVADETVLGVIGPMNSNCVLSALPTYERAGLALITQSATNPEITESGYESVFRLCPRDEGQGGAAARFNLEELGFSRVYLVDDKGSYGQGLADQVAVGLAVGDVEPVGRGQVDAADREFAPLLTAAQATEPELIYLAMANPAQAAALIKQARAMGITATFMGGDGLKERDQLIAAAEGAADGMYVTSIGQDIKEVPAAADFVEAFETAHGAMSIFSGQSYEATMVLLTAMQRAADDGELDRAGVLAELRGIEYSGILGFPISFDESGDVRDARIYVVRVEGADFAPVIDYPAKVQ